MRIWLLPYLLILIIHGSLGTRLIHGSQHDPTDGTYNQELLSWATNNGGVEEVDVCKKKDRSGKDRKLRMIPFTTPDKTEEKEENKEPKLEGSTGDPNIGGKEENISVISSPEFFEEDSDIAEMDYSLASRKSPVHN